jgi:hypothetical protein
MLVAAIVGVDRLSKRGSSKTEVSPTKLIISGFKILPTDDDSLWGGEGKVCGVASGGKEFSHTPT